jgi:hypothetical protein
MSEKPIERLNYFNGQRLEADDLRTEQEYHIGVQRWLMKTLFSPGVARGFDVKVIAGGQKILLEPGLALDDLGRAIILVAPVELTPQARFLCIRYAEHKERQQPEANCAAKVGGGATVPARWGGGPERIRSQPDIFWRADPPVHDTRELIIAELKLDSHCAVEKVVAGARHRASPLPVQQVHQISFEGEKDIAKNNSKVIHFFIRGGRPNAVTLYLRAREFSSLHYSEVGEITPKITGKGPNDKIQTDPPKTVDVHSHDGSTLSADSENPVHPHEVWARVFDPGSLKPNNPPDKGIYVVTGGATKPPYFAPFDLGGIGSPENLVGTGIGLSVRGSAHQHPISGNTGKTPEDVDEPTHTHLIEVKVSTTGSGPGTQVRGGPQLVYLSDLRIGIGKKSSTQLPDYTDKILDHVQEKHPGTINPAHPWVNETTFNGNPGHSLYESGTGPIRLDLIDGLSFEPDEYVPYEIELSVDRDDEGGCIQYNLYVE